MILEELQRFGNVHVKHIENALSLELDLEGLAVVAAPVADFARNVYVRKEVHLDLDDAVAAAGLAASALHIEAEPALAIASDLRLGKVREQIAYMSEHTGIRRRVRSRRPSDRRLVDVDDLVYILDARDGLVLSGFLLRSVDLLAQPLVEDLVDQAALARSRNARHADELAERYRDVDAFEVVLGRALDHDLLAVPFSPVSRHGYLLLSGEVLPRKRLRTILDIIHRSLRHELSAVDTGSRPYIYDVIGSIHRLLVMLDYEESISRIRQFPQRSKQLRIVLLMESDARLVQDVQDAYQTGSNLGRQPYPLRLAARKRAGRSGQRQIVETDVRQEAEPCPYLLEYLICDHRFFFSKRKTVQKVQRLNDRKIAELCYALSADSDREYLRLEPSSPARLAAVYPHVFAESFLHEFGARLAVPSLEIRQKPLECMVVMRTPSAVAADVFVHDVPSVRTVKHLLDERFRKILVRHRYIHAVLPCQSLDDLAEVALVLHACEDFSESSACDALVLFYYEFGVHLLREAQAVAVRACAEGIVEREEPRLQFRN